MGWDSFGVVRFDLGLLLQGQLRIAKVKIAYNSLIMVLQVGMVNQPIGNHGMGIFWCGRIWPWTLPSRLNEDSQT